MAPHVQGFAKPGNLCIDNKHSFERYISTNSYVCIGKSSAIFRGT